MSKTVSGKHYSKELIAQVITDYAEHIRSAKQLAAYYNVPYNTIKYWIKKYNKNGMDALLNRELDNDVSLAFHINMGFTEVNRIICFAKQI